MEQRSRSGLYRSGQRRAKQAARQAADAQNNGNTQQDPRKGLETMPHVGEPLDGHQYQSVVEEQVWAEKRASPEEEKRRPTPFDKHR